MTDMSGRTAAVPASPGVSDRWAERSSGPAQGGTGTAAAAAGGGAPAAAQSQAPVLVPPYSRLGLTGQRALADRLRGPYLQLPARPSAVPVARHHARQVLRDAGLKELVMPVELVVSEIVTNAVRACGGLEDRRRTESGRAPAVRLWLAIEETSVLALVWDGNPALPERQEPAAEAESGRGLLLVETLSAGWGSFAQAGWPGKVVWALCQI